ncbi:hypothetical protein ACFSQ7_41220 [Paenibacillus rhizoplanae]
MRMNSYVKIMERLELTLHPTKTRIVGLWTGDEGFDFLGMHHWKNQSRNIARQGVLHHAAVVNEKKAEERIRGVVKERLAPPGKTSEIVQRTRGLAQSKRFKDGEIITTRIIAKRD